ncbi:MAG: hypothetical protein EOM52_09160, partial [Clostridia bacterium]|nr:hypothetical protein [Clostridia bacterium]
MKKLLSLCLALALLFSMATPALASRRNADSDQPGWQQAGYESLEAFLADNGEDEVQYYSYYATTFEQRTWTDAYAAAHPDETAAFDANTYFAKQYDGIWTKSEYMKICDLETEEEFQQEMLFHWVCDRYWDAQNQAKVDAYTAAHPDEVAAFDANAYFEGWDMLYYESKEDFMTDNGLAGEDAFRSLMLVYYINDQETAQQAKDAWTAAVAAEPALTAQFLADVDGWIWDSWYTSSVEEYMQSSGYTVKEQAYLELYDSWKYEYEYAQEQKAARDARITELGGAPGQINVLVNDKMIPFGSAKPVLDGDDTLLAPADSLSKALGIMVKGDANGYAPVRFTAENAGWDVMWDNEYQTAVLLNRNGVIGDIDAKFVKLDELFVKLLDLVKREEGQSYKIDETLSLNLTAFDSLDGDKTYTANVKGTSTVKDGVISASLTLDLAGLVRQLSPELKDAITSSLPKKISASTLAQLLTGIKVDVILNPEDGLYLHAPILAQFLEDFDADSWMYFELPYYSADEDGAVVEPTSLNLGSMIYASHLHSYSYYYNQINTYSDMMAAADELAGILGNDRFTTSGSEMNYKLDTKTVNNLIAKATEDNYSGPVTNAFRTADVTATLSGGKLSFRAEVRPDMESVAIEASGGGPGAVFMAWLTSMADFRFTTNGSVAAGGSNYTMEFHWKNQFKATLSYSSNVQKTDVAPAIEPPESAKVVAYGSLA